jgi:hypothetical protein
MKEEHLKVKNADQSIHINKKSIPFLDQSLLKEGDMLMLPSNSSTFHQTQARC